MCRICEMLNLDEISDDEDIAIKEDDTQECILCTHGNHRYLDHLHLSLVRTTSKHNLYTILYDTFSKQMSELKKHELEHHTITKEGLIRHYEFHVICMERAVMEDVRLVKKLMETLQKKIVTQDGLNPTALNQWRALSTHKLSLLNRVKGIQQPARGKATNKPHDFSR